jgi:ribose-phosphate pyrophosphokinase
LDIAGAVSWRTACIVRISVAEGTVSADLMLVAGPASARLGADVADLLHVSPVAYDCRRFPDGELQIDLRESVRGRDVFVVQSTCPPVELHLMELLLLADACRRAGADRLTGVIPYFGYGRQERRTDRRSLGARVAADAIATGGFDRLMLIDAHTPAIEGFFDMPIDHLSAAPFLAHAAEPLLREHSVVVAPDLGAVKRAREFARLLQLPMAFVHKTRLTGAEVEAHGVIGDVQGRLPFIVDDMLSTGATLEAAVRVLRAAGAALPVTVAVTHPLLVGRARDVLRSLPIALLLATDTVPVESPLESIEIVSVASLMATAIRRDHRDESLADLRVCA